MIECRICKQNQKTLINKLYWFLDSGVCTHCKLTMERRLDTKPLNREWIRYARISEKAVDEYLRCKHQKKIIEEAVDEAMGKYGN